MATENGTPADSEKTLKPVRVIDNNGGCVLMEMGVSPANPQPAKNKAGLKYDEGKPRLGLVFNGFSKALTEVGKVGTFGAEKYTPNGWVSVPNAQERYTDAMYRHLLAEQTEELWDKESKLFHAAHAAWNALARLELLLRETEKQLEEGY